MWFNSLSFRLILLSTFWSIISLLIVAFIMGEVYRKNAQKNFYALLDAHLYNVISNVTLDEDGSIKGSVDLGDPRFKEPYSGWYWQIFAADDSKILKSTSLAGEPIGFSSDDGVFFDEKFYRAYKMKGFNEQSLAIVERKLYLDDSERLYHVVVSGNAAQIEQEAGDYQTTIYMVLGLLALASAVSTFLIVIIGLRPLKQVPIAFDKILNGEEKELTGHFPTEIQPLVNSTNRLISANGKIVERARTQVGNLAHALKTPLSVLLNEARTSKGPLAKQVLEQANRMQNQIQYYLDRARLSAQRENFSAQCNAIEILQRLIRVMEKLHPNLDFEFIAKPEQGLIFKGEQQDLEELAGNLIENATKFAKTSIKVSIKILPKKEADLRGQEFVLTVLDDGRGLSDQEISEVLKRGKRLDESKPGSGLGLSIVKDIVDAYDGKLEMASVNGGGLKVKIYLSGFIK